MPFPMWRPLLQPIFGPVCQTTLSSMTIALKLPLSIPSGIQTAKAASALSPLSITTRMKVLTSAGCSITRVSVESEPSECSCLTFWRQPPGAPPGPVFVAHQYFIHPIIWRSGPAALYPQGWTPQRDLWRSLLDLLASPPLLSKVRHDIMLVLAFSRTRNRTVQYAQCQVFRSKSTYAR